MYLQELRDDRECVHVLDEDCVFSFLQLEGEGREGGREGGRKGGRKGGREGGREEGGREEGGREGERERCTACRFSGSSWDRRNHAVQFSPFGMSHFQCVELPREQ